MVPASAHQACRIFGSFFKFSPSAGWLAKCKRSRRIFPENFPENLPEKFPEEPPPKNYPRKFSRKYSRIFLVSKCIISLPFFSGKFSGTFSGIFSGMLSGLFRAWPIVHCSLSYPWQPSFSLCRSTRQFFFLFLGGYFFSRNCDFRCADFGVPILRCKCLQLESTLSEA